MKLRYQFVVREVAGKPVAVAVGTDNARFNGMIKLNTSGQFIFEMLNRENVTQEEILSAFAEEYGVKEEDARGTVLAFIAHLRDNELLEE